MGNELVSYIHPEANPDLLLVVPPTYPQGREPDYNPKPPLGLEYLAASVQQRHPDKRVSILDTDVLGLSAQDTATEILNLRPEVVGFSAMQRVLPSISEIHHQIRNDGFDRPIIYGGIGATLCADEILNEFQDPESVVFLGEAEETLPRFLATRKTDKWRETPSIAFLDSQDLDQIVKTRLTPTSDLDQTPLPDRQNYEYYHGKSGYGTFMTSRGCPWSSCTFCSNAAFERRHQDKAWRPRQPELVLEELIGLYQEHGTYRLKTNDPNLFGPLPAGRRHVVELAEMIIQAKEQRVLPTDLSLMSFIRGEDVAEQRELLQLMGQAGWDRLLIGIESSQNDILARSKFNKGESISTLTQAVEDIRQAEMSVIAGFMIFNPYSTLETIAADLNYLKRNHLQVTLAKSLRIFNGVPIQHMLETEGMLEYHSPFKTYHEYRVQPEVAGLYYLMKKLHVEVEDPIRKTAQSRIWEIKSKGSRFNQRVDWRRLTDLTWQMESGLLEAGLAYYQDESKTAIKQAIRELYSGPLAQQLAMLDQHNLLRQGMITDQQNFTQKAIATLDQPPRNTLHEKYVWNKD